MDCRKMKSPFGWGAILVSERCTCLFSGRGKGCPAVKWDWDVFPPPGCQWQVKVYVRIPWKSLEGVYFMTFNEDDCFQLQDRSTISSRIKPSLITSDTQIVGKDGKDHWTFSGKFSHDSCPPQKKSAWIRILEANSPWCMCLSLGFTSSITMVMYKVMNERCAP